MAAAGLDIILGIDNDPDAASTFIKNFPGAKFLQSDIRKLPTNSLEQLLRPYRGSPLLFSACAPCQPFSKQRRGRDLSDSRIPLLWEFVRFVKRYRPELVFVENVPGLQSLSEEIGPFKRFLHELRKMGYHLTWDVVNSQDYGVPQKRRRLVIIASILGEIWFPARTHGKGTSNVKYSTVWDWIGDLPSIAAGEENPSVPNHRAAYLSPLNLKRIKATPEGGGREHWPKKFLSKCHRNGYSGHVDVYSRMRRNAPVAALTTRCISFSNGRFGHPLQDRAISVREAACLQTFPRRFVFSGSLNSMARQVGNAVPVLLAKRFGKHFLAHVEAYKKLPRKQAFSN